ncbi:unnamed protein product [Caenorhabditis brenneri]
MLLVIAFLPVNSALKLTERENEMRRETCGKGLSLENGYGRKVLNGKKAKIKTAPWNVAIEILGNENGLCTGTLISKRHVLTARHCFAYLTDKGYVWNTNNQLIFGCQNDQTDIVIDGNFSDTFKIHAGTDCGYRKNCALMSNKTIGISKLILPKVCDDKQLEFDDFAILELNENLEFSKAVQFVCIVFDDNNLFIEDNRMKLFGFGVNPRDGNNSAGQLRYETVKAEKCFKTTKKAFCTRSLSKNQLACMGDSGGGVVQMIDERVTVVGVIYQGILKQFFSKKIIIF